MKKHVNGKWVADKTIKDMAEYILKLVRGDVKTKGNMMLMTERNRQFFTWGARTFRYIKSELGCYGLQFIVNGLKFKGRVRIWYNPMTDYFDVEFLKQIKDELVHEVEDIDFVQLHNICHQFIEREDDPEV